MNFKELQDLSLAFVPQGKGSAVSEANRKLLLNAAVADICFRSGVLPTSGDFDSTEDVGEYDLSEELEGYCSIGPGGVWYDAGEGFKELDPCTIEKMKKDFPNFQDDASGVPIRYYTLGDALFLHPKPSETTTDAIRVYYNKKPLAMVENTHYPFYAGTTQTTEKASLAILWETIILYVEAKIKKILGDVDGEAKKWAEYLADLQTKTEKLKARPDIVNHKKTKMMGPRVG